MMRLPRSLQGRLLALVLASVAGVWIAAAAAVWVDVHDELDELLDGHLAQAAALLVVQHARDVDSDHDGTLDAPVLHKDARKVAFQVFDDGMLVRRSANAPAAPMLAPDRRFEPGFAVVRIDGHEWRTFAAQGAQRDVRVVVGEREDSRSEILLGVVKGTLAPLLAALPILMLAAWWAVRSALSPLRGLSRALAERRPQGLESVALPAAPSEMQPVIDALNGLLGRVGELVDAERRFTADAAHELRTPIAAIRAQAQVALGEADAARRGHALEATLAGCDRAARLVDQLLTLARLEAAGAAGDAIVDLAALARQVAAALAPMALARHQALEFDADERCTIRGDETLLAVLIRNLVDNALRYAPRDARIVVAVRRHGARVTFTVDDDGPGMAPADRAELGRRFFRVAGSEASGSGLGWSIVRRIAAVHRLDIAVGDSALGGLAVTVSGRAE